MSVGIPRSTTYSLPSPTSGLGPRRAFLAPPSLALPKFSSFSTTYFSDGGLRTPPVDGMSTVFQPTLASYDSHGMNSYPGSLPQGSRAKTVNDSRSSQYYRYPPQTHQQPSQPVPQQQQQNLQVPVPPTSHPTNGCSVGSAAPLNSAPRHGTDPATPSSGSVSTVKQEDSSSRRGSESLIYHSLQLPKCISPNGGNLSDFAAQMTCLFWFETIDNLKQAQSIRTRPSNTPLSRLPPLAKPYDQFRKWVYNVLSTTQVTQNVILLALLFIYRLKMSTPQIKGRAGSEYRLLTVALMLGNKFLDDNTYTNKTWAEVSGFAVAEIHVMEVEFLSNMRYNLMATKDKWDEWLDKLACFHEYYDRAVRLPASPIRIPSPNSNKAYQSPIPSPTAAGHPHSVALPVTPSAVSSLSPNSSHPQNWSAYQANAISPLATKPTIQFPVARKRSPESDGIDHPAKRPAHHRVPLVMNAAPVPLVNPRPTNAAVETSRLPVPHLTLVTDQPGQVMQPTFANGNGYSQPAPAPVSAAPQGTVSLPPLQPGVRAMSTVYQPPPTSMVSQQPALPATANAAMTPVGYPAPSTASYGTPGKHHSPGSLGPFNSSPLTDHFSQGSTVPTPMVHTPIANSPSVYLQQRPSPYKPVRHVNTLLYPPPSASLDQYHLSVPVPPNQMHYQPLGRRNDLRTGIVPEFLVFNRAQQQQALPNQGLPQGHYPS